MGSECVNGFALCQACDMNTKNRIIWIFSSSGRLNSTLCSTSLHRDCRTLNIWCQHLLNSSRKCTKCYREENCMSLFMYPRKELSAKDKHWSKWSVKKLLGGRGRKSSLDFFLLLQLLCHSPQEAMLNKIKYDWRKTYLHLSHQCTLTYTKFMFLG